MAKLIIECPAAAAEIAEKHAKELGYDNAADLAFELLRNKVAEREDALYMRCHIGEHNKFFGRSRREQHDCDRRTAAARTTGSDTDA